MSDCRFQRSNLPGLLCQVFIFSLSIAAGCKGVHTGPGQTALVVSTATARDGRVYSLDSDTLGQELVGENSNHGDLGTLGHRVVKQRRGSGISNLSLASESSSERSGRTLRGSDDDGSALGDVGNSRSSEEEGSVLLVRSCSSVVVE
jgi:hypothetical protein